MATINRHMKFQSEIPKQTSTYALETMLSTDRQTDGWTDRRTDKVNPVYLYNSVGRGYNKYIEYHSKLTYQLSFWNLSWKVDYHAGGKWFIHGVKRRKKNQFLSLKQDIHKPKLSII